MPPDFTDLNQNGVSFLFTDLDLAMTFMDLADTSHIEATTRRNHANARTAYETILRLSNKLLLTHNYAEQLMRSWPF